MEGREEERDIAVIFSFSRWVSDAGYNQIGWSPGCFYQGVQKARTSRLPNNRKVRVT